MNKHPYKLKKENQPESYGEYDRNRVDIKRPTPIWTWQTDSENVTVKFICLCNDKDNRDVDQVDHHKSCKHPIPQIR